MSRVLVVVVVVVIYAIIFVLVSLSSSPTFLLGFGLDLWSGDLPASKEQPQHFILPLESGVARYLALKVYFSTCSEILVGAGTPSCLRQNFRLRKFWPKLSGLSTVTDIYF